VRRLARLSASARGRRGGGAARGVATARGATDSWDEDARLLAHCFGTIAKRSRHFAHLRAGIEVAGLVRMSRARRNGGAWRIRRNRRKRRCERRAGSAGDVLSASLSVGPVYTGANWL